MIVIEFNLFPCQGPGEYTELVQITLERFARCGIVIGTIPHYTKERVCLAYIRIKTTVIPGSHGFAFNIIYSCLFQRSVIYDGKVTPLVCGN